MNTFKSYGGGDAKILVLTGLLGGQSAFDAALPHADASAFQYAVMDYRGYGLSQHIVGQHTVIEAVTDAVHLLEYLGWSRCTVVGHSLGGLVAQMLALAKPKTVTQLVLVAGASASGLKADAVRRQLFDAAAEDLTARCKMVEAGTGGRYSREGCMAIAARGFGSTAPTAFRGLVQSALATDVSAQVRGSVLPTTVIVGAHDPAVTAAAARATTLEWYRNAELEVLDGGHYPQDELPLALTARLEQAARKS